MQSLANFISTFGLVLIFNAACIALLGFMTMLGITNETTAKWSGFLPVAGPQRDGGRGRRVRPQVPGGGHCRLAGGLRPDEGFWRERLTIDDCRISDCETVGRLWNRD